MADDGTMPLLVGWSGAAHYLPVDFSAELTRRLVASARENGATTAAAAAHAACERAYQELGRWVGPAGARALLSRSVTQAQLLHPVLKRARVGRGAEPEIGGVSEMIEAGGAPAVAAGLQRVLETLVALLVRLLGEEMTARLLTDSTSPQSPEDESAT